MDGLVLTGTVLKLDRKSGQKDGRTWEMTLVHVLSDVDVYECQLSRDWQGPLPEKGQHGSFAVRARAYLRGGAVYLGLDLVGLVSLDLERVGARAAE